MFEDNEKDVIEAEETEAEEVEVKEETKKVDATSSNNGTKYHLIRENFNKALKFAIIGCGIDTVVWILVAIFGSAIEENVSNIICSLIYAAGCAGLIFVGIVELKLFIGHTNPKKGEDLASFLISLITFILAFICAFWFAVDTIEYLVWFLRGL